MQQEMRIGTINLDWLRNKKSKKPFFIEEIRKQEFDFFVVTETLESFHLGKEYNYIHASALGIDESNLKLDYRVYNKNEISFRVAIFSIHPLVRELDVNNKRSSVAGLYSTPFGDVAVYGSIIGTWGMRYQNETGMQEMENFFSDCVGLLEQFPNVVISGDLNTSFISEEKRELSQLFSRERIVDFCKDWKIDKSTAVIENCIDHIFLSESLASSFSKKHFDCFLSSEELKDKDHKGITLTLAMH